MRTGISTLPLHFGKAPIWLFSRMKRLAREITITIVEEYGPNEMLNRVADPYWFQAFGSVLGFDWHSSGLTTTACGALKEGIKGIEKDLGLFIAGGKGGRSRKTPKEIEEWGSKVSLKSSPQKLIYASRMSAKVDSTAIQDGYQLYHHNFFFTREGKWAVVQQGMPTNSYSNKSQWSYFNTSQYARRYHWLSDSVFSKANPTKQEHFVDEPGNAICDNRIQYKVLNLTSKKSEKARKVIKELAQENPYKIMKEITKMQKLHLGSGHDILVRDLNPKSIEKITLKTYERQPQNFEQLLGIKGVGPKAIRALTLISELTYGTKADWQDPVKYSFAHGGKDGIPYPVDKVTYEQSIQALKKAINKSRVERSEKKKMFMKLLKF